MIYFSEGLSAVWSMFQQSGSFLVSVVNSIVTIFKSIGDAYKLLTIANQVLPPGAGTFLATGMVLIVVMMVLKYGWLGGGEDGHGK